MESLHRQLERARFERAMEIVESMADRRVLLTTAELARINNVITGKKEAADDKDGPWRREPVEITLPSGRVRQIALITDPVKTTREKLHRATEMAESGALIDAVVNIYTQLVLSHVFQDGNRRTAVIAAHYFLKRYRSALSGLALYEIGLGDLRDPAHVELLKETVHQMAKFVSRKDAK